MVGSTSKSGNGKHSENILHDVCHKCIRRQYMIGGTSKSEVGIILIANRKFKSSDMLNYVYII
jgi:hypothetical protein